MIKQYKKASDERRLKSWYALPTQTRKAMMRKPNLPIYYIFESLLFCEWEALPNLFGDCYKWFYIRREQFRMRLLLAKERRNK